MNDRIRTRLEAAFGVEDLHVEPLGGGLLGRAYRVVAGDIDAAVRLPGQHGNRQSAAAELSILDAAAAAGIAPHPVRLPGDDGIVATRFLARARPWTRADARRPANIERLCERLRRLHGLDVELEPLCFTEVARAYAELATARAVLSAEQVVWCEELLALAEAFDDWQVPSVPCHNDLVASNVLDDGALWLIDFEFAVQGDPILDLASVAAFNNYDREARARLLDAYYGTAGAPVDALHFERVVRLMRLLAYFWSLAESPSERSAHAVRAFADELAAMLR
jgi:thiamine kinase-like enzyme